MATVAGTMLNDGSGANGFDEQAANVNQRYKQNANGEWYDTQTGLIVPQSVVMSNNKPEEDISETPASAVQRPRKSHRIKGVLKVAGKGLGSGVRYVAPKAARLAVKGTLAGTGAMIGIAAGLVSDDFNNVYKWGAAGAGSGWIGAGGAISMGENIVERASQAIPDVIESAASTYTVTAHGYEADQKRQYDKPDKAARKDKARQELYASKLGLYKKEDIQAAMQDYQQYREAGITDDDIIIKAMKDKGFGEGRVNDDKLILAGLGVVAKNETGSRDEKLSTVTGVLKANNASNEQVSKFTDGVSKIFLN